MPSRRLRPCNHPGCPSLTADRYCDEHTQDLKRYDKERPSPSLRGYGDNWKKVRKLYLREHPICEECGRGAEVVHHLLPIREGGGNEEDNLEALCNRCHNRITAKEKK